jgi:hypothetical protein
MLKLVLTCCRCQPAGLLAGVWGARYLSVLPLRTAAIGIDSVIIDRIVPRWQKASYPDVDADVGLLFDCTNNR